MGETALVIILLAAGTLAVRLTGAIAGQRLPRSGPWAAALNALPGCLIVSLVAVMLINGGINEWLAGGAALATAVLTRNLPATMAVGIAAIWLLRQLG